MHHTALPASRSLAAKQLFAGSLVEQPAQILAAFPSTNALFTKPAYNLGSPAAGLRNVAIPWSPAGTLQKLHLVWTPRTGTKPARVLNRTVRGRQAAW